ncbi:MAG TPA: hypothetical protein VK761_06355 [Solirubrobacteraceae bacterium]|jgi:hypothetical protein|nr:hypothetical protein [Solirubrobacteraceae bacterium]
MHGIDDRRCASEHSTAPALARRATVFGLDVHAPSSLRLLDGATAEATGRVLELTVADPHVRPRRSPAQAELVCDQREADGRVSFRIKSDQRTGYLIEGPAYGSHQLDVAGRHASCRPGDRAEEVWQRLLIAQVLPFAAVLRGLEVLHASAVVTDAGAIVLAGPSRSGKTTLALELCRRGARFLTDDVLALELAHGRLLGHPGAPVAGLAHGEARRLESLRTPLAAELVGVNDRERLLRMRPAAEPAPIAALLFLQHRRDGSGTARFEAVTDARMLLAATFNTVLRTPARLRSLLELCATVASRRVERVVIGPRTPVDQLADAIQQRVGARL